MTIGEPERAPGRPRDLGVDGSILAATQDLLIARGYAGMTLSDVARAAGTGKAAIYRRYPGKAELVVAAVQAMQTPVEVPDHGTLREDLLAAALHFARPDDRGSQVLASLLGEIGRDADLYRAARAAIGGPPVQAIAAVIQRWIAAGVVRADAPVDLIAGLVPTAAFGSVSLQQKSLTPEAVSALVDEVLLPALLTRRG
jgi:AcrR family transcriptional regulator